MSAVVNHHSGVKLELKDIGVAISGKEILKNISWSIHAGQNWAVIGPNGAGKTALLKVITGKQYYNKGELILENGLRRRIAYVNFERHSLLIRREQDKDLGRYYSGNFSEGVVTVKDLLAVGLNGMVSDEKISDMALRFNISHLLEKDIRQLSTGQMRKVLICEAVLKSPELLFLDEPYEGLDERSRENLFKFMNELICTGIGMVLVTHRLEEIPDQITHILCLKNSKIFKKGERANILDANIIMDLYGLEDIDFPIDTTISGKNPQPCLERSDSLVSMQKLVVKYGSDIIIDNIDWQVNPGQNWQIFGPNGAGKTTLLSLICGDNPQAYSNDIFLFGQKRGSGESIWDIKQKIGLVSAEFQIRYKISSNRSDALQVVLSGFFDSIGLFRKPNSDQHKIAQDWLDRLHMGHYALQMFSRLSDGEQRMILIARAMVKSPELLILDEPFQGLDYANRKLVSNLIDYIGFKTPTSIVFVSHQREYLKCITHELEFLPSGNSHYKTVTRISLSTKKL